MFNQPEHSLNLAFLALLYICKFSPTFDHPDFHKILPHLTEILLLSSIDCFLTYFILILGPNTVLIALSPL